MEEKTITEEKDGEKCCMDKNKKTILWVVIILLIFAGAFGLGKKKNLNFKGLFGKNITQAEAKAKLEKFITESGATATVGSVSEENGLYKIMVTAGGQEMPAYMTEDGTKLFPQAIDFAEAQKQAEANKQKPEEASQPAPKSDAPEVDLYVMAFCPFGNKAEDTIKPVYDLLKNKVKFNFHYIVTVNGNNIQSLHGPIEVTQDEREVCVLKKYSKDKWMDFVVYVNANCGSDGTCWEAGAKSLAIDTSKINSCVDSEGLALMKVEAEASKAAGASGSPTMTINGQQTKDVYQYGNSEAYKKAICDAFNTAPTECSKTLSSQTSTTQGGSCGN